MIFKGIITIRSVISMRMEHLLIEGFCDGRKTDMKCPCNGSLEWGGHCIKCSKFSYTFCPNEIALSDANGVVQKWIGFGGEMEPCDWDKREKYIAVWNKICKKKITEAFTEFMERKQKILKCERKQAI